MYADFHYYSEVFYGDMIPEDSFAKYAARASREIDRLTMGRANKAGADMAPRLSVCCCEIAETLYNADKAAQETKDGLYTSVSNDGVSVSYASSKTSSQGVGGRVIATAMCWLTAPQNLMYVGV